MRLYLANCTGQYLQVYVRLDFAVDDSGRKVHDKSIPPRFRELQPRQQVMFWDCEHVSQLEELVQQLERAGAVAADAVRTAKAKGHVKMIWQQDKPVPVPILRDVVAHNMEYLSEQGAVRRRRLAIASDHLLTQELAKVPDISPPPLTEFEFESDEEEDADTPGRVEQGITVKHGKPRAPATGRTRARKAA